LRWRLSAYTTVSNHKLPTWRRTNNLQPISRSAEILIADWPRAHLRTSWRGRRQEKVRVGQPQPWEAARPRRKKTPRNGKQSAVIVHTTCNRLPRHCPFFLSTYALPTMEHQLTGCLYPPLLRLTIFCMYVCALCRLRPQREARRFDSYGYSAESNGSTDVVQTADKCVQ